MAFNSKQYEWSDIAVRIGGRDIVGLRGIKYELKQEKEVLHAKGSEPHSIQRGNKTYEGEVTLTQSELETLSKAGDGDILSLSVNILVSYGDPAKGALMITDELQGCEFTAEPREMKQGDKSMEVTLPFIFLRKVRVA